MVSLFNLSWPSFLGVAELLGMDLFKGESGASGSHQRSGVLGRNTFGVWWFFLPTKNTFQKGSLSSTCFNTQKKTNSQEFFGGRKL